MHKFAEDTQHKSKMDDFHKELMDELESELVENSPKVVKRTRGSRTSENQQLRRDLDAALQRIAELEARVC